MTGRVKEEVVNEAIKDKEYFEKNGFTVLCPVISENVKPTQERLVSSKKQMDEFWPRDKQMIREAHVVFDMTPHLNSEGCKHEIGYARYFLYKPIIRIFPKGQLPFKSSVAYYEDDFITDDTSVAVDYAKSNFGTTWKRIKWRLMLYKRCLPKMVYYWITAWK